jgi:hypothetical protein
LEKLWACSAYIGWKEEQGIREPPNILQSCSAYME